MRDELPDTTNAALPKSRSRMTRRPLVVAILLLAVCALALSVYWGGPQPEAGPKTFAVGWRPIISQSGHGSTQTETFQIDTGQWRIKWATKLEAKATPAQAARSQTAQTEAKRASLANKFRLSVHSGVSGRLITVALDHHGAGSGIAYVAEEPRMFFLAIESAGLDWTVHVEEGIVGERQK
jgi:hypothetical protein